MDLGHLRGRRHEYHDNRNDDDNTNANAMQTLAEYVRAQGAQFTGFGCDAIDAQRVFQALFESRWYGTRGKGLSDLGRALAMLTEEIETAELELANAKAELAELRGPDDDDE